MLRALENMSGRSVRDAEYTEESLQSGTVGDVRKIGGTVFADSGDLPFTLVIKTQKQWNRHDDPGCWRREYDIYKSGLAEKIGGGIKLPQCYLLEEEDGLTRIFMEYVEGATGGERLHAAEHLGAFQADFHKNGERGLPFIRPFTAARSSFDLCCNVYGMRERLSQKADGFPDVPRIILNDYAARAEELLNGFDRLPLTLCQGDAHHDNLIIKQTAGGTDVYLIDWDCAGYGRMGEDAVDMLMEAFVYEDRDVSLLPDFQRQIIGGYCRGARGQGVDFNMDDNLVRDIFALAWGFRIAELYFWHAERREDARVKRCADILNLMLR